MQPLFWARLSHRDYNYLSSNDQPGKITVFMLCLENNVLLQIDGSFVRKRASLTVLKQLPLFCIPVPFFAAHFSLLENLGKCCTGSTASRSHTRVSERRRNAQKNLWLFRLYLLGN